MASTSRASRKRIEDTEIFQVLKESDVTIFLSEEDEDRNEPDSDKDGHLDGNSETNEYGGTLLAAQKLLI
jgi:hypothetical protein